MMPITEIPPPVTTIASDHITAGDAQYQEQIITQPRYTVYDVGTNTVTLMSSLDASVPSAKVGQKFRALAEQWYTDTMPLSSYIERILHPAYQKILVLGTDVVPFIMDEIRDMPNDWFWALRLLTETDPVRSEEAGNMQAMANAWLHWWEQEGPTWRQQHGL